MFGSCWSSEPALSEVEWASVQAVCFLFESALADDTRLANRSFPAAGSAVPQAAQNQSGFSPCGCVFDLIRVSLAFGVSLLAPDCGFNSVPARVPGTPHAVPSSSRFKSDPLSRDGKMLKSFPRLYLSRENENGSFNMGARKRGSRRSIPRKA